VKRGKRRSLVVVKRTDLGEKPDLILNDKKDQENVADLPILPRKIVKGAEKR